MPSKLAFLPHLISHAWFTWSPLGRLVAQCSCHITHPSLLLGLRGLQNHLPPSALDLLPHVGPLFLAVNAGACGLVGDASHDSVLKLSGVCRPRGYWRFLQTTPLHCSLGTFLTTSLLVWHCPSSWSCFLSPFSPVPAFLTIALRLPPRSWTAERSFSAGYCHLTKGPRSSGEIRWCFQTQGRAPALPRAGSSVDLGTAAWPQEQGCCVTSAGGVLAPPPDCTL